MACFVVCHKSLLCLRHDGSLLLWSSNNALEGISNFIVCDLSKITTSRENSSFVHEVGKISSCETWGSACHFVKVNIFCQRLSCRVHLQNRHTALNIWTIDSHLTIKSPWAKQGGIQDIWSVCGSKHNDTCVAFKSVHLCQQLIDGLLSLIITSSHSSTTLSSYGIDLIDENDAWRLGLGLFEQVTDTGCSHTHKQLYEF
mmetsp:Transcript_8259/g.16557  ORF Transcript_8259/g.16557 Transcript_8259/m.16557 type:complete len:200 (+) Transcript_8259:681-1280(+)